MPRAAERPAASGRGTVGLGAGTVGALLSAAITWWLVARAVPLRRA